MCSVRVETHRPPSCRGSLMDRLTLSPFNRSVPSPLARLVKMVSRSVGRATDRDVIEQLAFDGERSDVDPWVTVSSVFGLLPRFSRWSTRSVPSNDWSGNLCTLH